MDEVPLLPSKNIATASSAPGNAVQVLVQGCCCSFVSQRLQQTAAAEYHVAIVNMAPSVEKQQLP
jgi:hypothetical protein